MNDLVERFAVGEMATQVAVVSYSGIANVNFHLNNFTTRAEVQSAVQSVPFCDKPGMFFQSSLNYLHQYKNSERVMMLTKANGGVLTRNN